MRYLKINYIFTHSDDYRSSFLQNNPIFPSIIYKNMKKNYNISLNDKQKIGLIN